MKAFAFWVKNDGVGFLWPTFSVEMEEFAFDFIARSCLGNSFFKYHTSHFWLLRDSVDKVKKVAFIGFSLSKFGKIFCGEALLFRGHGL